MPLYTYNMSVYLRKMEKKKPTNGLCVFRFMYVCTKATLKPISVNELHSTYIFFLIWSSLFSVYSSSIFCKSLSVSLYGNHTMAVALAFTCQGMRCVPFGCGWWYSVFSILVRMGLTISMFLNQYVRSVEEQLARCIE